MRGESCILFPLVKNKKGKGEKKSRLYEELYSLTNKDRPLVNLLYALSLQDEVKNMFSPSELNYQGEPKLDAFIEKLHLKDIMDAKSRLKAEARTLGAISSSGSTIYYDDIDDIAIRVLDYNRSHEETKAIIKYSSEGFYIEVDTLNADNYNFNNVLNYRMNLLNELIQHLQNNGLNTVLSEDAKRIMNPLNVHYVIERLQDFKKSTDNINESTALLLTELFADNPLIRRLKSSLGDDLAQAISQVSGYKYGNNAITITSVQERQIKDFLKKVSITVKNILKQEDIDNIRNLANEETSFENTYMGTDSLAVKDALKELYRTYHLDKDTINALTRRSSSVSEVAEKLLQIKIARFHELKAKGMTPQGERKLLKAQRDIDNGYYLLSIVNMLEDLANVIKTREGQMKRFSNKLTKNPEDLETIREFSSLILDQLDIVSAFQDVMGELAAAQLLKDDDATGNSNLLDNIKELARDFSDTINTIEKNARAKQIEVVRAFLLMYMGEEKVKRLPDGSTVTVDDIMEMAVKDINIFDRFIFAANTTSDEMMNIIASAAKKAHNARDEELRKKLISVRTATKELYDSGSSVSFMYERDDKGYPTKIISDYDYARYDKELAEYKEEIRNDPDIDKEEYDYLEKKWIEDHTQSIKFKYTDSRGKQKVLALSVPIYEAETKVKDRLTTAQLKYYNIMMGLKAEMIDEIDAVNNNTLFDVIEISNDFVTALGNTKGDVGEAMKLMKNKIVDMFKDREDDTEYGSILDENNLRLTHVNHKGQPIQTLPLFYTHGIKDRSRVSTDFSRSMMAFLASSQHYIEMDKIIDAMLLAKDFMLTQRRAPDTEGSNVLAEVRKFGRKQYVTIASKLGVETDLGGLADDFFERVMYNKKKKNEGYVWGTKIRVDKLADTITGYTSAAGLATNTVGAMANILVGKIQMWIETGLGMGGEFFGIKDLMWADGKYFIDLPELLVEINSVKKSSKMGLLMEKFDVLDDFYEKIKETGFYKNPISKIIGNRNLFFLYGMGEHLLHAQGMYAVLHHEKVIDSAGNEVSLIEAFEYPKDNTGNGQLVIKDGYTAKSGEKIDEKYLEKIKRRIAYVNKSMHGAFGDFEKGMIHRYAFGRLLMNFRQWMPAHYARRFQGLHYDTDLEEYREGFYISAFKYLKGCVGDLREGRFTLFTRWRTLDDMQLYNLRRAIAETVILGMLTAAIWLMGPVKDKKGNWAARQLIYQLKRMQMEVMASNPLNLYQFINNIIKLLNSPMAALNTIEQLSKLLKLTDLAATIESGKHKGENRYFRNLEKELPWYGQICKMLEMGTSDDMFKLFND